MPASVPRLSKAAIPLSAGVDHRQKHESAIFAAVVVLTYPLYLCVRTDSDGSLAGSCPDSGSPPLGRWTGSPSR